MKRLERKVVILFEKLRKRRIYAGRSKSLWQFGQEGVFRVCGNLNVKFVWNSSLISCKF